LLVENTVLELIWKEKFSSSELLYHFVIPASIRIGFCKENITSTYIMQHWMVGRGHMVFP